MVMAKIKTQLQNRNFFFTLIGISMFLVGCKQNLVDFSNEVPQRQWFYRNHITANFDVKDSSKTYNIFLKLRHTAEYRYSNIFVLAHFIDGQKKKTIRYEYKLAEKDGKWLGSGSGNLFNYQLPLKTNYRFQHAGKQTIDIEQNMRDNPLLEVADLGILIEEVNPK